MSKKEIRITCAHHALFLSSKLLYISYMLVANDVKLARYAPTFWRLHSVVVAFYEFGGIVVSAHRQEKFLDNHGDEIEK